MKEIYVEATMEHKDVMKSKAGKEKTMKVILLILAKFLSCKVDIIVEVFICIQKYSKISSRC